MLTKTRNDFVYEEEYHAKPTIIENTGDDTVFGSFFKEYFEFLKA